MPRVKRRNEIDSATAKVKFNFDINLVNIFTRFIFCESAEEADIARLKAVIDNTEIERFNTENIAMFVRMKTLEAVLKIMYENGIKDMTLVKRELQVTFLPGIDFIDDMVMKHNELDFRECAYVKRLISELHTYIGVFRVKDKLTRLMSKINSTINENISYVETFKNLREVISELLTALNSSNSDNEGLLEELSFSEDNFSDLLEIILEKAQKPSAILQTGIRQLNALLSGGFQGGRMYTILGASGKFKSGTLLNIADQIRLYNPQIKPYERGRRKTILFLTLENSIEETIERIYDMYSGMDQEFKHNDIGSLMETLKENGGFNSSNNPDDPKGGIDISFMYRKNMSINVNDIYHMINSLNGKGFEVIAVVVDYIKRINSVQNTHGDDRARLSYVSKDLKSLAQHYSIPVITAMQLNRSGNAVMDDAIRDNKQDIARFVGSSSIGNAWDIIEDSDWVCMINLELQVSTNKLFLTFKRTKIRGKKIKDAIEHFNHPFVDGKNIRLMPDVHLDAPLSIKSLATDLESIDEATGFGSSGTFYPLLAPKLDASKSSSAIKLRLQPNLPL